MKNHNDYEKGYRNDDKKTQVLHFKAYGVSRIRKTYENYRGTRILRPKGPTNARYAMFVLRFSDSRNAICFKIQHLHLCNHCFAIMFLTSDLEDHIEVAPDTSGMEYEGVEAAQVWGSASSGGPIQARTRNDCALRGGGHARF